MKSNEIKFFLKNNLFLLLIIIYSLAMLSVLAFIFVGPVVYNEDAGMGQIFYDVAEPTCHQLTQRSFCYYYDSNDNFVSIDNCLPEMPRIYTKSIVVQKDDLLGYKLPVCSRCLFIYIGMLFGVIPLFFMKRDRIFPLWIFILFIIPVAFDGGLQLIGLHTSTNLLRAVTGFIAGFIVPIFLIPILYKILSRF